MVLSILFGLVFFLVALPGYGLLIGTIGFCPSEERSGYDSLEHDTPMAVGLSFHHRVRYKSTEVDRLAKGSGEERRDNRMDRA